LKLTKEFAIKSVA